MKKFAFAALAMTAFFVREYPVDIGGRIMKVCVYEYNGTEITRIQAMNRTCPSSIRIADDERDDE